MGVDFSAFQPKGRAKLSGWVGQFFDLIHLAVNTKEGGDFHGLLVGKAKAKEGFFAVTHSLLQKSGGNLKKRPFSGQRVDHRGVHHDVSNLQCNMGTAFKEDITLDAAVVSHQACISCSG